MIRVVTLMNSFVPMIKDLLRPIRDAVYVFGGYMYDFARYIRYGGIFRFGSGKRDYRAVKIYHRLEKSLSFKSRRPGAGMDAALDLLRFYSSPKFDADNPGFQERVGVKVLRDYLGQAEEDSRIYRFKKLIEDISPLAETEGGVLEYANVVLEEGKLDDPEKFFMSRYSVRDFKNKKVESELLARAIRLAMKSPSVCNRQAWHVYHIQERENIDTALSLQNGNRGFGHEVPCLLVIAADLAAFDSASERYQPWIDGGMFSMSLLLALHSLGLGACCLNWSKGPIDDLKLRRLINIRKGHSILMMVAVGYASNTLKVCHSARRNISEIYTRLD